MNWKMTCPKGIFLLSVQSTDVIETVKKTLTHLEMNADIFHDIVSYNVNEIILCKVF